MAQSITMVFPKSNIIHLFNSQINMFILPEEDFSEEELLLSFVDFMRSEHVTEVEETEKTMTYEYSFSLDQYLTILRYSIEWFDPESEVSPSKHEGIEDFLEDNQIQNELKILFKIFMIKITSEILTPRMEVLGEKPIEYFSSWPIG